MPATIRFHGTLSTDLLEKGMIVAFTGRATQNGKLDEEVDQLNVLSGSSTELKYDFIESSEPGTAGKIEIIGRVADRKKQKLQLQIPKSKWTRRAKMTCKLSADSTMQFSGNDLNRVLPGDEISNMLVFELSNGERVVTEIEIRLTADREQVTTAFHDKLEQEFSNLSNEPGEPRELRSANYVLYTDVSERSAQILLAKLETMHGLVGNYFGKRPRIPIECYVVADINKWKGQQLHPSGVAKILEPSGITMTNRHVAGRASKSHRLLVRTSQRRATRSRSCILRASFWFTRPGLVFRRHG